MAEMIFSVITPSYNQGEFIEDTIRSVISQEGDFYIEYFIMDGGSKDNTVEILKKYDRLLKEGKWDLKCLGIRYRWVSEKDKGQVDAIEKGFAAARGDIGCWLNSDDVYYDSTVFKSVLKEFREDKDLLMLTGDGMFMDKMGNCTGPHRVQRIDFTELLYLDYHILQPSTFIRKLVYENERLDRSYNFCFDAEYFIRIINKGYKYRKIGQNLSGFRIYPEIKTISGCATRYRESLKISRDYGSSRYFYVLSVFYKYWAIVLANKYPSSAAVTKALGIFRVFAYKFILGRVR